VQRQHTGSAGKIANCQIGTSLIVATRTEQLPMDFALYLPKSWLDDDEHRADARIPWDMQFATKPELGLQLIPSSVG
jgi:SRSO17 transposase